MAYYPRSTVSDLDRLLRAKKRLTQRLTAKENAQLERGRLRQNRWLRIRLHRIDVLLEREGLL